MTNEKQKEMKLKSLLLALMFILTSLAWAQDAGSQAAPPTSGTGSSDQMRSEYREKMMEMHRQQMEAMKADMEKMKSSLAQMKTNVAKISEPAEKGCWQTNVDMWEVLVGHMDQMLKHMESMGPGMMHEHGMGGLPLLRQWKRNRSRRAFRNVIQLEPAAIVACQPVPFPQRAQSTEPTEKNAGEGAPLLTLIPQVAAKTATEKLAF